MPRLVSLAVLHGAPPDVLVAEDLATLHRLLALKVVSRTDPAALPPAVVPAIRAALLDERWGDAVEAWMRTNDERLDVYETWELFGAEDVALTAAELQFSPLFRDRST